jgi:hypothetical protein
MTPSNCICCISFVIFGTAPTKFVAAVIVPNIMGGVRGSTVIALILSKIRDFFVFVKTYNENNPKNCRLDAGAR